MILPSTVRATTGTTSRPIERFKKHLILRGIWSEAEHEAVRAELDAEILAAHDPRPRLPQDMLSATALITDRSGVHDQGYGATWAARFRPTPTAARACSDLRGGIVGVAVGMAPTACGRCARSSSPTTSIRLPTRSCPRRAPALPLGQRVHRADDDPHALRRRHLRRPDPQPEPRGHVHAGLRPAHGHAVQPLRRQRAC